MGHVKDFFCLCVLFFFVAFCLKAPGKPSKGFNKGATCSEFCFEKNITLSDQRGFRLIVVICHPGER